MWQCPRCPSNAVIKNGCIHTDKATFAGKPCGGQFVDEPPRQPIAAATKTLVDKLLLERKSLAGSVRVTGSNALLAGSTSISNINRRPAKAMCQGPKPMVNAPGCRTVVVCWYQAQHAVMWLARTVETCFMVGCFSGGCSTGTRRMVRLPVERQCAVCYTERRTLPAWR
jgi:hypothetical protein